MGQGMVGRHRATTIRVAPVVATVVAVVVLAESGPPGVLGRCHGNVGGATVSRGVVGVLGVLASPSPSPSPSSTAVLVPLEPEGLQVRLQLVHARGEAGYGATHVCVCMCRAVLATAFENCPHILKVYYNLSETWLHL